jgi:hypothetical protein
LSGVMTNGVFKFVSTVRRRTEANLLQSSLSSVDKHPRRPNGEIVIQKVWAGTFLLDETQSITDIFKGLERPGELALCLQVSRHEENTHYSNHVGWTGNHGSGRGSCTNWATPCTGRETSGVAWTRVRLDSGLSKLGRSRPCLGSRPMGDATTGT